MMTWRASGGQRQLPGAGVRKPFHTQRTDGFGGAESPTKGRTLRDGQDSEREEIEVILCFLNLQLRTFF